LRWGGLSDSPHFDLHQCNSIACAAPQSPLFDNLLRFSPLDGGRKVIPDLAYKWDVSADGLTYTFHLREGVKFHDGALLTSEDVKATFDRVIFPPAGFISPRQSLFEAVAEVKALDPLTVRFKLKAPRVFLPSAIASGFHVIERKKTLVDNNFDLKKLKPGTPERPGTGPFIFQDHQTGEFWKMKRNPDYWNSELPYLDGIEMYQLGEGPPSGAALLSGRVDYAFAISADQRDEIQSKYASSFTAVEMPLPAIDGVYINHERGPLGDARVRRAINMVVDRCAIKKAVAPLRQVQVGGWVIASDAAEPAYREATLNKRPGYSCPTSGADIATAKQLLADAGFPNGQGFPKLDMMVRDVNFFVAPMAPTIQAMLKQHLNIQSDIRVTHLSVWVEDQARGNYDQGVNATLAPLASTPLYWLQWFTTGGSGNWNRGASNPEFDALVKQLVGESDPQKSAELVRRGTAILEEWSPMIITGHAAIFEGWANYVKGHGRAYRVSVANDIRFDTVWLDK
jgi:peptide/nickel transport system substrate-binding protein